MAQLFFVIKQNLTAKMQLLFIDDIRESIESHGGHAYGTKNCLNAIIEIQSELAKSLPDVGQNYETRSPIDLFRK